VVMMGRRMLGRFGRRGGLGGDLGMVGLMMMEYQRSGGGS
jgi:hypothetical protein